MRHQPRSEAVLDAGSAIAVYPLECLERARLPRLVKFGCWPVCLILCLVTTPISGFWMVAGIVMQAWERS